MSFFRFRYEEGTFSEMPLAFWFVIDAVLLICLLLVLSFAPRGFSPSTPVFPSPQKLTNNSKFQFDQESGRRRTTLWMCHLQIIIYLLIP